MASQSILPDVPVPHSDFISYIESHPDTSLPELLEPYKQYDAKLREVFAQEPQHPSLSNPHLNIVPIFAGHSSALKIRARDPSSETQADQESYIMSLSPEDRRPNGSPAIVDSVKDFQTNFALFCESSLVDLDWSNVVAAGSSVVTCLLPVPGQAGESKRALRQYYHETVAPASDVDLFIYGLDEEEAVKKIVEIEKRVKDSILTETTTIRTKNAITIASQYPTRHIQIVLRIYKSVAEILTGFDVDCSCAAYDGSQVWAAPRALTAYMTQINTIDLTRRSPSYESRLSKYSRRGFEVHWPLLQRSRVDPTIFERNFGRTVGLARLLVLERLPSKQERERYMDQRRQERGRPRIDRNYRSFGGNIKEQYEDEVAEWVAQEDVSDYHTFTIPYGPNYNSKKIEKMLYSKDLLLNSEWNKPKDREVNLHRHPAFFGYAEDIINDCCGSCPKPVTPDEHDVAEQEAKIYVSGKITFIKDDPGRQAIGSFNPITDDDWTEMAYVGNTARLCQAIVDEDLEHVVDWLEQEGADPNTRDYTGRTPLHLAVTSSSPEIVKALIDHGARIVARLADGRTALHLAAIRGNVEMVRLIMQKSEANEEEEAEKEDVRKKARIAARENKPEPTDEQTTARVEDKDGDFDKIDNFEADDDDDDDDDDAKTTTTGSYMKVKEANKKTEDAVPEENDDDPDVYNVDVLAWDLPCSALHFAILNGHIDVVKELVQSFGADVLLPVKLLHDNDKSPRGAIMTLVLALKLPLEKAKVMVETLLSLGASSAQADTNQITAFQYISTRDATLLDVLIQNDEPAVKRAINHFGVCGARYSPSATSPLTSAIRESNELAALKLLENGAAPTVEFKSWVKSVESHFRNANHFSNDFEQNQKAFVRDVEQPIVLAIEYKLPNVALRLLEAGADPNTLLKGTKERLNDAHNRSYFNHTMESLLDYVRKRIKYFRDERDSPTRQEPKRPDMNLKDGFDYLQGIESGSYKYFVAKIQLEGAKSADKISAEHYEKELKTFNEWFKGTGRKKRIEAIDAMVKEFEKVEQELLARGAKTFEELHPEFRAAVQAGTGTGNHHHHRREPSPFEITFKFYVPDLTDETCVAYIRLFQAAWDNDLDTIKNLTLAPWGEASNMPLNISAKDVEGNNVFGIAVLRGHHDLARALVEISFAQYDPSEEAPTRTRYRISSECGFAIDTLVDDDKFTIDNIGELSTQVKSKVSPLDFMICGFRVEEFVQYIHPEEVYPKRLKPRSRYWTPMEWSVATNDKSLYAFLFDLVVEWTDRLAHKLDGSAGIPSINPSHFMTAVQEGRIELLAEMIKHTGAGLELESLVNKSEVKYRETPKYYQGLSVHGKKRPGWINAARGTYSSNICDSDPPLLYAAFNGNLESVEWFLSDAPARHYLDFAEAYKHDKYIQHINKHGGGFEKVLRKWLGTRHELALHLAVMSRPGPESAKLIKYLIRIMPGSLELKSTEGYTPLSLAFLLHRFTAAKLLIEAGADQTVRNAIGSNILHLLLRNKTSVPRMLSLIDPRLVPSLLSERTSVDPGSLTPLAHLLHWLHKSRYHYNRHSGHAHRNQHKDDINHVNQLLNPVLDFAAASNYECLELLDGSGDTPLHWAVREQVTEHAIAFLARRPDLVHHENSIGRTPLEIAQDAYLASRVSDVPKLNTYSVDVSMRHIDPAAARYVPQRTPASEAIWKACGEAAARAPGKRKLVSLLDANEVAKRLAKRQAVSLKERMGRTEDDGEEVEEEVVREVDEVRDWYRKCVPGDWDEEKEEDIMLD